MDEKTQSARIKLGGLWKNTAKSGDQYISGNLSASAGIQIFQNKFKQNEKDPDFIMYLVQKEVKKREASGSFDLDIAVNTPNVEGLAAPASVNDIPF